MRGGPEFAARIKCAGRGGPTRGVRALCGAGLNWVGRPALPPLPIRWEQWWMQFQRHLSMGSCCK